MSTIDYENSYDNRPHINYNTTCVHIFPSIRSSADSTFVDIHYLRRFLRYHWILCRFSHGYGRVASSSSACPGQLLAHGKYTKIKCGEWMARCEPALITQESVLPASNGTGSVGNCPTRLECAVCWRPRYGQLCAPMLAFFRSVGVRERFERALNEICVH